MANAKKYKGFILFVSPKWDNTAFNVDIHTKDGMTMVGSSNYWTTPEQAEQEAKEIIDSWEKKS